MRGESPPSGYPQNDRGREGGTTDWANEVNGHISIYSRFTGARPLLYSDRYCIAILLTVHRSDFDRTVRDFVGTIAAARPLLYCTVLFGGDRPDLRSDFLIGITCRKTL